MNKKATIKVEENYYADNENEIAVPALSVEMNSGERFDLDTKEGVVDMLRFFGIDDITISRGY